MQENHGVFHAIDSPYGQHKTARSAIPVVVAVSDGDLCLSPLATTHIGASIGHLLNLLSMLFYLSFFYFITSSWFFKTLSDQLPSEFVGFDNNEQVRLNRFIASVFDGDIKPKSLEG